MAVKDARLQKLIEQAVDQHFEKNVIGKLRQKRIAALGPKREDVKEEDEQPSPEEAALLEQEFNAAYGQE